MRALFALFGRSLREDVRARLPAILRATLVLIILLIVWSNQRSFTSHTAPGREFLLMTLLANLGFLAVAALSNFASAITEEKEDETLTLLRMTNLSPLAILFGKSTTRLVGALLLLAVQIPFTLLAITLGGVHRDQILGSYAVLGATTFFLCNLALLCSVICRTTARAGLLIGVVGAILYVALPIIFEVSGGGARFGGSVPVQTFWQEFCTWGLEMNPMYALVMIQERQGGFLVGKHVTSALSGGLLCFLLAWLLFDRFTATAGESTGRRKRKARSEGSSRKSRASRPSIRRPLAWKDFHFLIGGWRGLFFRFFACAVVFFGAYVFVAWERGRWPGPYQDLYFWRVVGQICLFFAFIGFILDLGFAASRIFGEERRSLTLGGLAGLPRTTGWLIRQKFMGCLPVLLPSAALFGFGFCIQAYVRSVNGYGWGLIDNERDVVALFYAFSQAMLAPVLIADLSLRLRRGAMPAGIAIVVGWNIFTAILMDLVGPRDVETVALFFDACLCLVAAVILAVLVYRGIPRAAAAD